MSRLVPRLPPSFRPLAVHIADNGKLAGYSMGNETCDSDSISLAAACLLPNKEWPSSNPKWLKVLTQCYLQVSA